MTASAKPDLNAKQQRFVLEYLVDLNATQAALRAGYSPKTAGKIGFENLSKPEIAEAIAQAMAERSKRTEITADKVLLELAKIAFANASDFFKWGPNGITVLDSDTLTEAQRAVVSEVSETPGKFGNAIRVKLHSKLDALDKIARHVAFYNDKVNLDIPADGGLASLIKAVQGTSIRPVGSKPEGE